MPFHKDLTGDEIHALNARTYADIAARDADLVFQIAENIDREVRVNSPIGYFKLFSVGPTVWVDTTSAGTTTFDGLLDTPSSKSGQAGKVLQVDDAETDVEFGQQLRPGDSPQFVDLTLTGDLTVQGIQTFLDTQTLQVEDKNIELGKVTTPSDATADGGGITLLGTTNKIIAWLNSIKAWTFDQIVAMQNELSVGGLSAPATDASIDLKAVDKAILHNRLTTVQRDALTAIKGMEIYNTDTDGMEFFNGVSWQTSGGGDVSGPASSVDNALTRFNGTGGKNVQGSPVTLDDQGVASGLTGLAGKVAQTPDSLVELQVLADDAQIEDCRAGVAAGNFLYLISKSNKFLSVWDITEPATTVKLGGVSASGPLNQATDIKVQGCYAFTAASNRIASWDISVPNLPVLISEFVEVGMVTLQHGLAVAGAFAYIARPADDRIDVFDISNPENIVRVGSLTDAVNLDGATGIDVQGCYLYVACENNDSLQIVDITDPTNPVRVGGIVDATNLNGSINVQVQGRYAYVAAQLANNVEVVDVEDPTTPVSVGRLTDATNLNDVVGLALSREILYTTGVDATAPFLASIDISDPSTPVLIDSIAIGAGANVGSSTVILSGNTAYVPEGRTSTVSGFGRTLAVYDLRGVSFSGLEVGPVKVAHVDSLGDIRGRKNLDIMGGASFGQGVNSQGPVSAKVDGVSRLLAQKPANTVYVFTASQLPATLVTGTKYIIAAPIIITAGNEITIPDVGNVTIESTDRINNTLSYSGTGTLFSAAALETSTIRFYNLDMTGNLSTSRLFNLVSLGAAGSKFPSFSADKCSMRDWGDLGIFDGFGGGVDLGKFGGSGNLDGFKVINSVFFGMENSFVQNFTATSSNLIDIASDVDRVAITLTGFVAQPNERLINIDSAFTGEVIINTVFGLTNGRLFDSGGLDEKSIYVNSQNVSNNKSSKSIGSFSFNGNTDSTAVVNGTYVPIDITGLIAGANIERFSVSDATAGELTYDGLPNFEGTLVAAFYSGSTPTEANYRLAVSINGAVPVFASAPYTPLSLKDTGDGATLVFPVSLVTDDTIQVMIAGDGTGIDVAIAHGQLSIQ